MRCIVLTGAASGIGRAAARELGRRGARLVLVDRNADGLRETAGELEGPAPRLEVVDLSSMGALSQLVDRLSTEPVDALINNAGVLKESHELTVDGFELTFAVNTLAPFLLTRLLWPRLLASGRGRVVNVSSLAYRHGRIDFDDLAGQHSFHRYGAYSRSKLAVLLLTRALARRAADKPLRVNAVHPGVVGTGLGEGGFISRMLRMARPLLKSPEQGARGLVYLAAEPEADAHRGEYFVGTRLTRPRARGRDDETGERLYDAIEALLSPWGPLPTL